MQINLGFIISLAVALYSTYLVNLGSPGINPFITFFLIPLFIFYITSTIIGNIWPGLNKLGREVYDYTESTTLGNINNTGYLQIFPPILLLLIIFSILLYTRQLG